MAQQTAVSHQQLTHERARELLQRSYGLINEHDLANVPTVFTEDIVFEDDAAPETVRGHEDMSRFLGSMWTAFPDFHLELHQGPYLSQDGSVAARVRMTGTMKGKLDPPGFLPTGAPVSLEFGAFYEFEGDRIRRARIILNMTDAGVQIGALPAPGSPGEKVAVFAQGVQARVKERLAR